MESEKRYPVSVYFTPKAYRDFQDFVDGSGYGSSSRTVEEIILAFKKIRFELDFFGASSGEVLADRDLSPDAKNRMVDEMREKTFEAISEAADRVDSQRLKERRRIWRERGIFRSQDRAATSPDKTR
jgi:hypothetical protein